MDTEEIRDKLIERAHHHAKHAVLATDNPERREHLELSKLYFDVGNDVTRKLTDEKIEELLGA